MPVLSKKILYRSTHRGCKEMDKILGDFAQSELMKLSDDELHIFDNLLHMNDPDIFDCVLGNKAPPVEMQDLFKKIIAFNNNLR